jgi:bifunctional non-homologous end joining protein LigD
MIAFKNGDDVRLLSRNRLDLTGSYPAVTRAVAALPVHDVILDGEATGGWGRQGYGDYHVFDILWLDGRDLTGETLETRRAILAELPLHLPIERVVALDDEKPWERACSEGWEGVIAKRRDSRYEHRRSPHWLKMKCEASEDFVIGGFTDPQGKRVGLGALLVGQFDGEDLCFAGKVGTGFDTSLLLELRARLDALEIPKSPFTRATGLPRLRAHWVRPEIVVRVGFIESTGHDKLRHPRLLGVQNGAPPREAARKSRSRS